jgi:hypothetical protein
MVWKMSDIQKTLELEGMLLRAAEEKLLALEAENAALRELLKRAKWYVLDSVEYIEEEEDIKVTMELYGSIRGVINAASK